jgi:hypothetical protein
MIKGNKPAFVTSNRQDIIDFTIANFHAGNFIKNCHVTEEVSCSDHRYVRFNITIIGHSVEFYRNPHRTDWESFRSDLPGYLRDMEDRISNFIDFETAARQFQDVIICAYNNNCRSVARRYSRNISWWNQDLGEKRRKVRRLYNAAKKSGYWTNYRIPLTECNKALRPRESPGIGTVRLKTLLNVADFRRFSRRMGRVQFVLPSWKTENILKQRTRLRRNYSGFISLVQKLF